MTKGVGFIVRRGADLRGVCLGYGQTLAFDFLCIEIFEKRISQKKKDGSWPLGIDILLEDQL